MTAGGAATVESAIAGILISWWNGMNEFVEDALQRISTLKEENESLRELVVLLATGQTGDCWLDSGFDGDGSVEPYGESWKCGCGKWSGPEWQQTDPQASGRPDVIAVALLWSDHYLSTNG